MILAAVMVHLLLSLIGMIALWRGSGRMLKACVLLGTLSLAPVLLICCANLAWPKAAVLVSLPAIVIDAVPVLSTVNMEAEAALLESSRMEDWTWMLTKAWIIGVLVGAFRLLWDVWRLRLHLRGLMPMNAAERSRVLSVLPGTASSLRLQLLKDSNASGPYSVRFRQAVLVMPPGLPNTASLECIVRHEWAHLRHRDSMVALLWRLVCAVYWWNPLVHILAKRVSELQEWRADAEATQCDPQQGIAFSHLLLTMVRANTSPALAQPLGAGAPSFKRMERRIRRLVQPSGKPRFTRTGHVVFLLCMLSSVVACAQLLQLRHALC